MNEILEAIGALLALSGSIISLFGVYYNNQKHDHYRAMEIWSYSNLTLAVWAFGNFCGLWTGGLSAGFMCVMYSTYTVSNFYGLKKYGKKVI